MRLLTVTLLSLLLTVVSVAAGDAATHDGLRKLTAANFTLTNEGAWLIEFFSPTCTHCKKFGPTWSELSQNKEVLRTQYPDAPFTLAQVDCVAQRDVCTQQGVQFLPRLTLYQDGKQSAEEYKGNRNYPEISAYIDKFAAQYRRSKGVKDTVADTEAETTTVTITQTGTEALPAALTTTEALPAALTTTTAAVTATSTDTAATSVALPSGPNPNGELLSYGTGMLQTPEQLKQWLDASSGQGPTFVKFFAPWCPHCKAMAAAYQELASSLKGRVNTVEVDCEANKAVCSDYGIRGYPHLRMYNKGQAKDYNGGRNHDAMLKWALKAASSAGLRPVASSSELAEMAKEDEVLFLYLHSPGTAEDQIQAVDAASQILFGGRAHVAVSSEASLLERYSTFLMQDRSSAVPSSSGLLVFKDHSVTQPISVLYPSSLTSNGTENSVKAQIERWLSRGKYALLTELTAANFEETVRNDDDALVVLAALSDTTHYGATVADGVSQRDEELRVLRSLALDWRDKHTDATTPSRQVVWAWIDADRWKSPLSKLYGIQSADLPVAVLVDGHHLQYYPLPRHEAGGESPWLDSEAMFAAITDAVAGKTAAKSSRTLLQKSVRGAGRYSSALLTACVDHPYVAFAFVFVMVAGLFFSVSRSRSASNRVVNNSLPMYSKVSTVKSD